MEIKYANPEGSEVSLQQSILLEKYLKIHSINDLIKKEELFDKQQLISIVYFKDQNETDAQVVSDLYEAGVELIIRERISLTDYLLVKSVVYHENGYITMKFNTLYDSENGEFMGEERIDLETNEPIYDETLKLYFDRNLDPENEVFEGKYKEDGTLDYIKYNHYSDHDAIWFGDDGIPGEEDIPTLCAYAGISMEKMQYYLTATLLP